MTFLPLLLTLAACDSAGVRVVENGPISGGRIAFRLSGDPIYRVGWADGVLGAKRNELDIEAVVLYRLEGSGS